jgi:hypothetical protein
MYKKYGKQVEFYMVYISEAHPSDGRVSRANTFSGIDIKQPKTFQIRAEVCQTMCSQLKISLPPIVDAINNKARDAYNAGPDRLYLVSKTGTIAFKGDRGPRGFQPAELEAAIKKELAK